MDMIIQILYAGRSVYLMYGDEDWNENLIESLLKIIQQRYGYNAYHVESDEEYTARRRKEEQDAAKKRTKYIKTNLTIIKP